MDRDVGMDRGVVSNGSRCGVGMDRGVGMDQDRGAVSEWIAMSELL